MSENETRRGFLKGAGLVAGGVLGSGIVPADALAQTPRVAGAALSKGGRIRALLEKPDPIMIPHVNNIFIARLAENEGFPAVRVGGSVIGSSWHGIPELWMGFPTITEEIEFASHIAGETDLPVVADGDDGGPTAAHVYRSTKLFERAGIAAVVYEDGALPLAGRAHDLITKEQMVDKIKAAVDARKDPSMLLLIRNDSMSEGETMDQAIERGVAYAEAGADMLWFSGMKMADHAKAAEAGKRPTLTSARPTMTAAELKAAKINMIFYHIERVGYGAVQQAMREWKTTGKVENALKMEISEESFSKAVGAEEYRALGKKYGLLK